MQLTGLSNPGAKPDGSFTNAFANAVVTDVTSDTIKSVAVSIRNFQSGKDHVTLNSAGIQDLLNKGIAASFNANSGELTFTGGALTVADAQRLLRNVQFATTDSSTTKSLAVSLSDEFSNSTMATEQAT